MNILVKENGSGITKENMSKILAPFFTKKTVRERTGLETRFTFCQPLVRSTNEQGTKDEV